jgi:hypothetical protein
MSKYKVGDRAKIVKWRGAREGEGNANRSNCL